MTTTATAPRIPVGRTYRDAYAQAEYDSTDAFRAQLDAAGSEWIDAAVRILSANGSGRATGRGVVVGFLSTDLVAVRKANGKAVVANLGMLVKA